MKIIGYLLLIVSCTTFGYSVSKSCKNKLVYSLSYINMLSQILANIEVLHLPLNKIFEKISDKELDRIGYLTILQTSNLYLAYCEFEDKFVFDKEHYDFCEKLGTLPLSDTIKLCNFEIARLNKIFDNKKSDYDKRIKLYPALSMLIGLAVIILII